MKNISADGLRGIAAMNVAISHFIAAFLPAMLYKNYPSIFAQNPNATGLFDLLTSPPVTLIYNGHLAVFIFFVLSGYVLALPYFTESDAGAHALRKRLAGRYLRLNIPIAVAIFLSYCVYQAGAYWNVPAAELSGSGNWLKTFYAPGLSLSTTLQDAVYGSLVLGHGTLIPPLWTLKIEFIGSLYLLLFYIAKPNNNHPLPWLLAGALICAIHRQESIYYLALFAGSLLSRVGDVSRYRLILLLVGLYFGGFQFHSAAYDFLPTIGWRGITIWESKNFYNAIGALLLTTYAIKGFGRPFFDSRLVQWLGKISFSTYLLHFIVLCSLSSYLYLKLPLGKVGLLANFVIYASVCLISAALFERFVDRRAIDIARRFANKVMGWLRPALVKN